MIAHFVIEGLPFNTAAGVLSAARSKGYTGPDGTLLQRLRNGSETWEQLLAPAHKGVRQPARKKGQGMQPNAPSLYRDMAERGRKSSKARVAVHLIEGEYVTFAQMTARLQAREPDLTIDKLRNRFQLAQRHKRPITWAELAR